MLQQIMPREHNFTAVSFNLNSKQGIKQDNIDYKMKQKIEKNKQLIMMMLKLQKAQQSLWGRFFRFEKSELFVNFQKKFTFKQIFRLRIDDILYYLMLVAICIVFALLPSETVTNSYIGALLVTAYRYMLSFLLIFSAIWLISSNKYRHFIFLLICVVYPLITMLGYMGILPANQVDTSTTIFGYLHVLSLWVVYAALYIVYPIKEFVRNKVGSLYSYLYALPTLTLFFIWPAYSLIQEMSLTQQLSFNFITQNKALIITFLAIVVFTFHILTHQTFFQGNLKQIRRLLLIQFKKSQLAQAIQKVSIQQSLKTMHNMSQNAQNKSSFLVRNFNVYTRIMSFIVFGFTLGIQIYVFIYLANNIGNIYRCIAVMIFCVGFLIYGCIMNLLPISRQTVLYVFSIISFVPAALSPIYCQKCTTNPLSFYQYIFVATALPYTTIFWSVVRSLSKRRPFLKINMLVILYIFIHIPLTIFMINNLGMISQDSATVTIVNIILLGIVGLVTCVGLVSFIVWLCYSVKQLPNQQSAQKRATIDYNYFQQGNPAYIPYTKKQSFSLDWLSTLDIRNLAQLFNCIVFILCQLSTMYFFNQLNTTYSAVKLTSQTTRSIIYAQFVITFVYFTYAYSYIVFKYDDNMNIIGIFVMGMIGVFGIVFGYVSGSGIADGFKIGGGVVLVVAGVAIGLHIVKNNNKDIMNFLSGVLIIIIWIFLFIPYVIALPIISIFIELSKYGEFISGCILGTTLLLIVLVSIMSIVFNILMNKFEQQKKVKFIMQDVQTFLKEQGIETQDQVLHVMHQSFEYRDQKYVFFMKRGFPIRVFKQVKDQETVHKTVVYNSDVLTKKESMKNITQQQNFDYCWACLTFFCGVDQGQMEYKIQKVAGQNMIDQDQMQELVPDEFFKNIFIKAHKSNQQKNQKKYVDLSKLYSSKTIILRHLTQSNKHLGEQYTILRTKKNKKLANQIWHIIFNFLANQDDGQPKIIFNDFLIFCSIVEIGNLSHADINGIYLDFCSNYWKENLAMDLSDFSLVIEELTKRKYPSLNPHQDNKYKFLVDDVYPRLCQFAQFKDVMNERTIKSTKMPHNTKNYQQNNNSDASSLRPGSVLSSVLQRSLNKQNLHSMPDNILQKSPFLDSFSRHHSVQQKLMGRRQKLNQKKLLKDQNKLIEPARQQVIQRKQKKQKKIKQKSCKQIIYQKYQSCKNCTKKIEQQQQVIKRKVVKPWEYLAVESIRIMEYKDQEWKNQKKQKQYEFRCILNNILMAVFKVADLYTYMEITIMNPQTGWQSVQQFSILTLQYRVQLYISFALVLVCAVLGIKGITYIFEDRLGLTQTRVPASFPHPMFFFTFIYKLLILSLFNTISMTLLSTFMCDWTSPTGSFQMILASTDTPLQCFSSQHNIYVICSIISIILYYPLSAYTMPNFQFAEKRLDLKYKPSYLIIFFQVNFVLAAGKVLLSQMTNKTQQIQFVQILFQSINIFCLALLAAMVLILKPCLISWFNIIQLLVVELGLVWNILGLVLYLTGQWLLCVIIGSATSGASIILAIIVIRRKYFTSVRVEEEMDANDMRQLQLGWKYKKQYNLDLVRFQKQRVSKQKQAILDTQNDDKKLQNSKLSQDQLMHNKNKNSKQQDDKTNYVSNKIIKPDIDFYDLNGR